VNVQQNVIENATKPQMPSYSALWFIVNHNICFKLPLVFLTLIFHRVV